MDNKKLKTLWLIFALLFLLKTLIKKLASLYPGFVETYYSRGIYPIISGILTRIANLFPFSLGEVILLLVIVIMSYFLIAMFICLFKRQYTKLFISFSYIIWSVIIISCLFDWLWALNNYRLPLEENLNIKVVKTSTAQLATTYEAIIKKTNELRSQVKEDSKGLASGLTVYQIRHEAYVGFKKLSEIYDFIPYSKVIVKSLMSSPLQTMSGYIGVYLYYIGEPNINYMPPVYTLPYTASHEIAHQKGFAHEGEANYIAFLACRDHDNILFQYSGYLSALRYVGNALYRENKELYKELRKKYSDSIIRDLNYNREFWIAHENKKASKIVNKFNDAYLKSHNQPFGIKSYGLVVDLLIMDFLEDGDI